jgi:hypothetical protein
MFVSCKLEKRQFIKEDRVDAGKVDDGSTRPKSGLRRRREKVDEGVVIDT